MVVLLLAAVSALVAATFTLYAERRHPALESVRPAVLAFAETPKTMKDALDHALDPIAALRAPGDRFDGSSGLEFSYAPGQWAAAPYLLINRYDAERRRSVSELVDLDSQETLHRWEFDTDPLWQDITFDSIFVDLARDEHTGRFRNFHTYLNADGSLVAKSNLSPLFAMDLCGGLNWINTDHVFHHSIERDADGFYWVPVHLEPASVDFGARMFMDDALSKVSPEGKVVWTRSLSQILEANGLEVYTRGMGHEPEDDPIHLNDIQPMLEDGEIWRKGDLWLSMRNRSMVALYRPETNEILWWHVGPWIHQHDVNIFDERTITIFDNDAKKFGRSQIRPEPVNGAWSVDVVENAFTPLQPDAFKELDLRTTSSGRTRLLPDGSLYIEEGVYGRLVILAPDGSVRVAYFNRSEDGELYKLNWSRIIDRDTGDAVRALLDTSSCR